MKILVFGNIAEGDVVESLIAALRRRGHFVVHDSTRSLELFTQKINFSTKNAITERIKAHCDEVQFDAFFSVVGHMLPKEILEYVKSRGLLTLGWMPDDPVGFEIGYKHTAPYHDIVLNCGGKAVLKYYEDTIGVRGINFPFWTDSFYNRNRLDPLCTKRDVIFTGNVSGKVKLERYSILKNFPFKLEAFGNCQDDEVGLFKKTILDPRWLNGEISISKFGLDIPQIFANYDKENRYYFKDLEGLGHFQFPMRVVRYAAAGVPVVSIREKTLDDSALFPEMIVSQNIQEAAQMMERYLRDPEELQNLSDQVYLRYLKSFSADSRVRLLENLIANPNKFLKKSLEERLSCFSGLAEFPKFSEQVVERENRIPAAMGRSNFYLVDRCDRPQILSVMSMFRTGGLETRVRDTNKALLWEGADQHLVTSEYSNKSKGEPAFLSISEDMKFREDISEAEFTENLEKLKTTIEDVGVDVVDAHTVSASVISFFAAAMTGRPIVVNVHGNFSLNRPLDFWSMLYICIVLPFSDKVIVVSEELANSPFFVRKPPKIVANAVDLDRYKSCGDNREDAWAIVSRLDSFKAPAIKKFLRELSQVFKGNVYLFGAGGAEKSLVEYGAECGLSMFPMGENESIENQLARGFIGVAGMGRVILEGFASDTPVFALGYDGIKGYADGVLFDLLSKSNFSGRGVPNITHSALRRQLKAACSGGLSRQTRRFLRHFEKFTDLSAHSKILLERSEVNEKPIRLLQTIVSDIDRNSVIVGRHDISKNVPLYLDIIERIRHSLPKQFEYLERRALFDRQIRPMSIGRPSPSLNKPRDVEFTVPHFDLEIEPKGFEISTTGRLSLTIDLEVESPEEKLGLALVYFDFGMEVGVRNLGLSSSNSVGPYKYLDTDGKMCRTIVEFDMPPNVKKCGFYFRRWRPAAGQILINRISVKATEI